ncbi:Pentatricopeptide repeat-containing protein [Apostasia shenzhenica]|uniref:Pentatricopeptide repeat-containing protein n=1 Tax=Apostasia shenzhenica TaxID=1088818 RepID=A0A2I0BD29_9ASPA|nr:Pentatricopeptide repeat-containing protein [Apostasia shenzhenica]
MLKKKILYSSFYFCYVNSGRAGNLSTARNLFDGLHKRDAGLAHAPNVVSYTTLIRCYCSHLMLADAIALFDEMVVLGLKPNKITYNTLVKGICEAGRMDLLKKIMDEDVGFRPEICTFNTLISAHCNNSNVDDALKVFDKLIELRIRPDLTSYSTLQFFFYRCL